MNRRRFIKTGSLAGLNIAVWGSSLRTMACQSNTGTSVSGLAASFDVPPAESLAGCYWWWLTFNQ